MFSKSTCLALFTLAASTFSAQAVPLKQSFETETFCNTATIAISTVVQTQTVEVTKYITAANSQSTGSSSGKSSSGSSSSSSSNSSGSSSNSSGSSSNSSGSSSKSSGSSSNSGSSSKSSGSKGSSGDKGKGSKSSTTTTAAATTTSTAVNIDNSGGSSSSSGSGSDSGADSGASAAAIALQTSLVLDPSVVCSGFANDGQSPPIAGQTASLTTTNNFINFCAITFPVPLTNGQQITSGSCNPAPIGLIPSTSNMPSAKFTFPTNFATIASDTPFTITMALKNMQAGTFTDATKNYFAAPQTLNAQGQIIGHSHFVVESLTSIDQTTPNDPVKFVFFKGIDDAGVNGILSTPVAAGLPAGAYRVCSINSSSNHQPVIVPVAQHGALDDCSYFTAAPGGTATATGAAAGNSTLAATGSANSTVSAKGSANATAIATGSNSTVSAGASAVGSASVSASASAVGSASVASASAVATGKAAKGKGGSKSVSAVAASASAAPAVASAAAAVPAAASAAVAAPAVASAAVAKPAAASAAVAAPAVASASAAAAVPVVASAAAAAPPAASASAVGAAAAAVPDKSSSKSSSKGGKN